MYRSRRSILLAGSIVLAGATQTVAQPVCRPYLSVQEVRLSGVRNLERKWTAVLDADASRCAATSGRFQIYFVREKENAPELEFSETFTWQAGELGTGQIEASIGLWIDEAVHDYRVYAAPCACRD